MSEIILYDIPSRAPVRCWSLNPWKARMALNYKGIPYKTIWVEYPDIAPLLQEKGVPVSQGGISYTLPSASFPDGTTIMDSLEIAKKLDELYPSHPVFADDPIIATVQEAASKSWQPIIPEMIHSVCENLLTDKSTPYFEETRSKWFGMPLAELNKTKGGPHNWENAKAPIQDLAALLKKNNGTYILGDKPSFADFIVVGLLRFLREVDEQIFNKFVSHDPAFQQLYEACKPWLERNDH